MRLAASFMLVIAGLHLLACGSGNDGIIVVTATPEPTLQPQSAPSGSLVFLAQGNGTYEAFLADLDTGELRNLSSAQSIGRGGLWSPDASQIAFVPTGEDSHDIFVMNQDGSSSRNVSNTPDREEAVVSWSPDGVKLLYGYFSETSGEYWVMNADGSAPRQVLPHCRDCGIDDWSPDGLRLVGYRIDEAGTNTDLFTIDPEGTNAQTIASGHLTYPRARWSPDGTSIAFVGRGEQGEYEPTVLNLLTGETKQLPANSRVSDVQWSSDSGYLAVAAEGGVLLIEVASGEQRTLVAGSGVFDTAWSFDDELIAFTLYEEAHADVFVVPANGGEPTNISNDLWSSGSPRWFPNSHKLMFWSSRNSQDGFYALPSDGSPPIRLTSSPVAQGTDPPFAGLITGCVDPGEFGHFPIACTSPDGRLRAELVDRKLVIRDLEAGGEVASAPEGIGFWGERAVWSPDSRHVAFYGSPDDTPSPAAYSESAVYVLDVESGSVSRLTEGEAYANSTVALQWSLDGAFAYYLKGGGCAGGCWPGFLHRIRADGSGQPEQLTDIRVLTVYGFVR